MEAVYCVKPGENVGDHKMLGYAVSEPNRERFPLKYVSERYRLNQLAR